MHDDSSARRGPKNIQVKDGLIKENLIVDRQPTIFVVDDDPGVNEALRRVGLLLETPVLCFPSADEFLAKIDRSRPGCLVLETCLTGMSGFEFQQRLTDSEIPLPFIMISGQADVRIAVEAMRRGAITFLEKPCRVDELTAYVRLALQTDSERRASLQHQAKTESQLAQLTLKEREVLDLVATGMTNREIAASLNLSIRAVEDRRARVMKKLGARSVVDLVHLRIA